MGAWTNGLRGKTGAVASEVLKTLGVAPSASVARLGRSLRRF
jgi:hypothetical protein